jgi:hypothetical protein
MKFQWKKLVSCGAYSSKFVKVDGVLGHILFDTEEEANQALIEHGCQSDSILENWCLQPITYL